MKSKCYAPKGAFLLVKIRKVLRLGYFYGMTFLAFAATVAPGMIRADTAPQHPQTTVSMRVTAYSSSPDETDDTPFTTANGTEVHDGVVATNVLPFGTQIMMPEIFGNKVFTVEDRMAERIRNTVDIWMPTKAQARYFGARYTNIVIVKGTGISER